MTPEKTIERISLYRRIVGDLLNSGKNSVFSHEIAKLAGVKSSQVRHDFMFIGTNGRANAGYNLQELKGHIEDFLTGGKLDNFCVVGVGNLGRAVLAFFQARHKNIVIKAAFDKNPALQDKVIQGCRCYSMENVNEIIKNENIEVGIIAVPAEQAQPVAQILIDAGVKSIVNFAPVPLKVRQEIFVENVDLTMYLEKAAFFTRNAS
ncbi:MAG: redox-sensing transcriptional repressor Rex [Phycisphaerae bacterium]|jgi:redox-sensing transcriptional repressor|nr:redox-sensing transcriptional repressor Rex [Phycisphaerae bacterium]